MEKLKEHFEKELKEDFGKIKNLEDLKDFLLRLLPKMMETDIETSENLLRTLQTMKHIMQGVDENGK